MKAIRRKTPIELLAAIYAVHQWTRKRGESMTARVAALYIVTIDHRRGDYVATPKN